MSRKILSFSGGQSSGYLLRREMDKAGASFDRDYTVCFDNTGKEHNATLDFVHDVETKWGIEIVWLEYCRANNEHSFRVVDYKTAARRTDARTPFDEMLEWCGALPNVRGRGCSGQLKVRTTKRYLKSLGLTEWEDFIGIRADEAHRKIDILNACPNYITPHFPLIDDGITMGDVYAFWNNHPFRLNIPNYMGNCDLCFLKARWKRIAIMRQDPAAAQWWINWEKKKLAAGITNDGAQWISGKSYEGMLADALHPEFAFINEDTTEQDIPCSCAVGGYRDEQKAND